jgi:hypothetical protein
MDLKDIVDIAIERRNCKVWRWEGDGGFVAFYFSDKNLLAVVRRLPPAVYLIFIKR